MNPIEPIGPTPVTRVERRVEKRRDEEPPPKRQQRDEREQPEPEDENGLDVRV